MHMDAEFTRESAGTEKRRDMNAHTHTKHSSTKLHSYEHVTIYANIVPVHDNDDVPNNICAVMRPVGIAASRCDTGDFHGTHM